MWFCLGEECLTDEGVIVAKRAAGQGVKVRFEQYEAMPHCFAMLLDSNPGAPVHYREYAGFCREVVEGKVLKTNGEFIKAKTLERESVDVEEVTDFTDLQVQEYMQKGRERIRHPCSF